MSTQPVQRRQVQIVNREGLHARPVMRFVELASRFDAAVSVEKDGQMVDGREPMELMLLEGVCGSYLSITTRGPEAEAAIEALIDLVARGFDEA